MKTALVGYTGFVGSNLMAQTTFDKVYNSKNIQDIFKESFDLVIYSGVRAEKFLANQYPEQDFAHIEQTIEIIKKIKTKQFVLISTVDVYKNPSGVDESTQVVEEGLHPYGLNRRYLEKWVETNIEKSLIVRLPALYGINLKKNFLFDLKTIIPFMLKPEKLEEIAKDSTLGLKQYYTLGDKGFYVLNSLTETDRDQLKEFFENYSFNALSFTDSRNAYSFYHLNQLYRHIQLALQHGLRLVNLGTEPITAAEIYQAVKGEPFENHLLMGRPICYDIRTQYAACLGGDGHYLVSKEAGLEAIVEFLK